MMTPSGPSFPHTPGGAPCQQGSSVNAEGERRSSSCARSPYGTRRSKTRPSLPSLHLASVATRNLEVTR